MLRIACFVESNINFKISDHALLFLWKLNSILRSVSDHSSEAWKSILRFNIRKHIVTWRKYEESWLHSWCHAENGITNIICGVKICVFSNDERWMCASFHGWENDFSPFSFIPIFLLFQFLSTLKLKLQFSISRFTKGRINPFTKDCWSCCTCFEWNSTLNIFFNLFQYLHGNARVKNRYNSVEMLS